MHRRSTHASGWGKTTFRWTATVLLLLWGTGVVMYFLPLDALMDMTTFEVLSRRAATVLHGVLVWGLCVLCGRSLWPHVRVVWQRRDAMSTWLLGVGSFICLALVAAAGLALLYGTSWMHDWASFVHWWLGLCLPVVLVAHAWRRFAHDRP